MTPLVLWFLWFKTRRGLGSVARHVPLFSWPNHMAKTKKPPYTKGRSSCIYCGRSDHMTEEHIWADWLRQYIPRDMPRHKLVSAVVHSDLSKNTVDIRKREGDPHSRKLKIACRDCNNGWMSRLQTNAKPYLVPMLLGKEVSLYKNGQAALVACGEGGQVLTIIILFD